MDSRYESRQLTVGSGFGRGLMKYVLLVEPISPSYVSSVAAPIASAFFQFLQTRPKEI